MAVSDAEFERWLRRDHLRCILVEATCMSAGLEVTHYFSNIGYVTRPSETPANQPYLDVIVSIPTFTSRLSEFFTGASLPSYGDIEITNVNGVYDSLLEDSFDGRALKVYLGDRTWAKSDFRLVIDGVTADIYPAGRNRIALKARDKSWMLNVQLQTAVIGGADVNKDHVQPICLGPAFNIEPVLEDSATRRYRVNDGQVNAIPAARCDGNVIAYTNDLANGRFTLTAAPSGRVTCDVQGAKPGGVYHQKCADQVQYLVTSRSQLTAADLEASSFTAFNALCPQTLNEYARARSNLLDSIDALVTSVGGYWTFTRDGQLRLGRIDAPSGTPVMYLTADDVRPNQLSAERRDLPIASLRLGYARNWTVQPDSLAGILTAAERALYGAEYQIARNDNGTLAATWKLARTPDTRPTRLTVAAEAAAEAARYRGLFDTIRATYRAGVYMAAFKLNLGDVISLDHPRYGFAGGALAIVVGIDQQLSKGRSTLYLWK